MDRLASMRVFDRVASEGGFAAAARALELSPAAVTRGVADLEAHLGTRLLQRTTRRVVLTEAGEAYLGRIRPLLQDLDEADAAARSHTDALTGVLRVHAPPVLAAYAIAPLVAEFRQAYPRIEIDLEVGFADASVEDHDLTLLGAEQRFDAGIVARKVIEAESILVASPAYLRRRGVPRAPADLAAHDCLRLRLPGGRRDLWRLWPDGGARAPTELRLRPALWSNHVETLLRAALEGAGIAAVTAPLVAPDLASGALLRVLAPWNAGRVDVWAALPSRRFVPRRTRVFLDFVVERMREHAQAALRA
jgi:DNA-binding transcriptional LysR family regulator